MDFISPVKIDRLSTPNGKENSSLTPSLTQSWHWPDDKCPQSPVSSCSSPEFAHRSHHNSNENRRGRPRAEALTNLMIVGSTSPSAIKCDFCKRVFPREKSLQAHLRTHTGTKTILFKFNTI